MDQTELRELEARCVQDEAPWCLANCPVHVDVKAMTAAIAEGDFDRGLSQLRKKVPFPKIISRVCEAPCVVECKRAAVGGSIRIRDLERSCVEFANDAPPVLPPKPPSTGKRIAAIGSGLSGLTAAYELLKKGHDVVVFEAAADIGGRLRSFGDDELPRALLSEELAIVERMGAEFRLGIRVGEQESVQSIMANFDAIYVGTGAEGEVPAFPGLTEDQDGRLIVNATSFFAGGEKLFAGGGCVRGRGALSPISSISDGRRAAISIDRFLQKVSMEAGREKEGPHKTRLFTSLDFIDSVAPVRPTGPETTYSRKEAMGEAARCIRCECMECVKVCEYLRRYGSYPKRYVREVYNNLSIVMGMRKSNEFIDSCALCGLCAMVCPSGLDMGQVNLEARRIMTEKGKMPPSAFDFALRDLSFSTGPDFFLSRGEPGHEQNAFLFFPGCQLSASLPAIVERVYADLRAKLSGGVALTLGCCGAPAEWAGQVSLAQSVIGAIEAEWKKLGSPTIIAACPTCRKVLSERMPEASVKNLLEVLEGVLEFKDKSGGATGLPEVAIHDACTARADTTLHETARRIVVALGYPLEELKTTKETAECCGYGGLMYNANKTLAAEMTRRRAEQSRSDYVSYCAMCRDRFIAQDKHAAHILELMYADGFSPRDEYRSPTFSERRENRRRLKTRVLRDVWGERTEEKENDMKIRLAGDVKNSMEDRFILMEDIQDVVRHAENAGEKLRDDESGLFITSYRPGNVTYWVWYERRGDEIVVQRVYSHRMGIIATKA